MRLRRETGDFSISLSWDVTNRKCDLLTTILPKSLGVEDFVGIVVAVYISGVIDAYHVPTTICTAVDDSGKPVILINVDFVDTAITYDPSTGKLTCNAMHSGGNSEPKR